MCIICIDLAFVSTFFDWTFYQHLVVQSVPVTTKVVSSNIAHGEDYSIQHVIKFVSDLRKVVGFLRILRFLLSIKLNATI